MKLPSRLLVAAIAACAGLAVQAQAQTQAPFANRPVTIIVGFPAGGSVDAMARIIASRLGTGLGVSVIVDNKPGFSGNIGAQYVAQAAADGTTLLMAPVTSYAGTEAMLGKASGFSIENDFVPVDMVGEVALVLSVNPATKIKTLGEFTALAKSRPGEISFASSGNGSTEHVVAEMFMRRAGVAMLHVPYKGGSQAMVDLLGGQVQSMFATTPNVIPNVASGKLVPIAVSTAQRNPALPQVPTMAESGLPGFDVASVYAIMAPTATPRELTQRLNAEITKAMQDPETRAKVAMLGITPISSSLADARTRTQSLIAQWKDVVRTSAIKAE
jgi:tripartite-type tricarboxylate transporter receptor subunit TctC